MKQTITCGEGQNCIDCKIYHLLVKMGITPTFTKNENGHCNHYESYQKEQLVS